MRTTYTVILQLALLIFLGLGFCAVGASAQSTDHAAQAGHHYKNAVAAISKNDWQTAKSELLAAEKLAPQNALVHYDLALAYSHTGQVKSAQTELNKALRLGLPAEQKQSAEQLDIRLTTAQTNIDGVTKDTPGASARQNSRPKPSVAETLDWLKDKLTSEAVISESLYNSPITNSYRIADIQGCRFRLTNRQEMPHELFFMTETQVDMSEARTDVTVPPCQHL
jgi:tetratricopeptide (TPR) repeat protein